MAMDSSGASLGAVWEPATGYHKLGFTLVVNGPAINAAVAGTGIPVLPYSAIRDFRILFKRLPGHSDEGIQLVNGAVAFNARRILIHQIGRASCRERV